jgi:hypothetical protein
MACRILGSHFVSRHEIDPLRNPIESGFAFRCRSKSRSVQVDSWNKADPDFLVISLFNKSDIVFIRSTVFDPHPLVLADLIAFSFINLIDDRHFFCWHKFDRLHHEVEAVDCLSNVDFFEGFNKNVSLGSIRASNGQDGQGLTFRRQIYGLSQKGVARSSLELFLDAHLEKFWVVD